jgi:hypothetical protein
VISPSTFRGAQLGCRDAPVHQIRGARAPLLFEFAESRHEPGTQERI